MTPRGTARAAFRGASFCAMVLALAQTGCGSSERTVVNRMASPAQAQEDLKRALDVGAISPSEYEQQVQKLRASR
jgi:hypothetical protein